MENVALPKKIDFQKGDDNQGLVTIEPLYTGYGMTLGNSLRRVLLSSLSGAAVVGVKIKGSDHEFMAVPGVKEDALEIILNLKELCLKTFTDEEIKLELKVSGKKVVKAKDIVKNSDVEIANPDLILANITDAKGSLEIEIFVKAGRGYKMVDASKKESKEIGYLEVDSIFSPVTSVSLDVDNARVGKMTNWDKLILDIKTDGTISPEEAFNKSVEILVDQFSALIPGRMKKAKTESEEEKEEKEGKSEKEEKIEEKKEIKKETKEDKKKK